MIWERIAEQRIEQAMAAGEFDGLRGRGRPLPAQDEETWDPAWRLVGHVLRNAGLAPAWVEEAKVIRDQVDLLRRRLTRVASVRGHDPATVHAMEGELRTQAGLLNRRIESYNLSVPHALFQIPKLAFEQEWARSGEDR